MNPKTFLRPLLRPSLCTCTIFLSASLLPILPARADTLGYWRFEDGSNLGADSSGAGLNLTNTGVGAIPLPASGVGSAFPATIPSTGAANTGAGNFEVSDTPSDRMSIADPFPTGLGDFTVEAMVNQESVATGTTVRPIVSQWGTATSVNQNSWQLATTGADSGLGARNLIVQMAPNGTETSGNVVTLDSDFQLTLGVDYYVAASFDFSETGVDVTFYFQDLTNGGPLQSVTKPSSPTSVFNSDADFEIGRGANSGGDSSMFWDGLIDEVRLSDTALSQSELLITPVPEPGACAMLLGGIGMLGLLRRNRRGRRSAS